ncbi:MAG: PD-(D/E)XK nuclease-like domain-containing protein [Acidimicrobiales bacterium]
MTTIDQPGIYDMPVADYLADPVPGGSLSQSGANRLLPPSCPARFRWWADNPPAPTATFDFGHAAHRLILGAGPDIVVVDADDWRTKAAQQARKDAHEAGQVPLLRADYEQAQAMETAVRKHPIAGALFEPGAGTPERSLFWVDEISGIWRRARLDWLPAHRGQGRFVVPDYKTCRSADPETLQRAIWDYRYNQQAAWYLNGIAELAHDPLATFVFVFQEKEPPYLVTVAEPDPASLRIGRWHNRRAIETYHDCMTADHWPGYADDVELIPLPAWVENRYLEEAL